MSEQASDRVHVRITHHEADTLEGLVRHLGSKNVSWFSRIAGLLGSREATWFNYFESAGSCELRRVVAAEIQAPIEPWEGRVFNDEVELRWVCHPGERPLFEGWLTREVEDGMGREVEYTDRRYYLIGQHTPGRDPVRGTLATFTESRFPASPEYPVGDHITQDAKYPLRAFVLVREYRLTEPCWDDLTDDEAILADLDAPINYTHRFKSLGCGRDR